MCVQLICNLNQIKILYINQDTFKTTATALNAKMRKIERLKYRLRKIETTEKYFTKTIAGASFKCVNTSIMLM